jgi:hypothetical protein
MEIMKIGGILLLVALALWSIKSLFDWWGGRRDSNKWWEQYKDENKLMGREARRVGEQSRKRR